MKNNKLGARIKYWFDKQMAKGTAVMIAMLTFFMVIVVLVLAVCYLVSGGADNASVAVWNMLSTTINAWMPEVEESDEIISSVLIAIGAVFGLFFTSFIIGIISSGVEERLEGLRQGNSKVIENDHVVLLGYKSGDYTLLKQLVLAAGTDKRCIVVAEDCDKCEMEDQIRANVDFPKNVRLICRNADTTDPVAIECCAPENSSLIIVQPIEDSKTVKTLLALSKYMDANENVNPRMVAAVSDDTYMIPYHTRQKYGFTMLRTNAIVGGVIAHSCTQPGLSTAFIEVFDYRGSEFYIEDIENISGKRFKDIFYFLDNAVAVGVLRNGETFLNPHRNFELHEGDKLIVFEQKAGALSYNPEENEIEDEKDGEYVAKPLSEARLLIIGFNSKLDHIVSEIPGNITGVILAGIENAEEVIDHCREINPDIDFEYTQEDVLNLSSLEKMTENVNHIVMLCDNDEDEQEADTRTIMTIIKLRDIKDRLSRNFTITAEMRRDDDRKLVTGNDSTDFIVSSNMSAMVLTQIAENKELYETFHEILSSQGNEFELKSADYVSNCIGTERTISQLRRELIHKRCILLGYVKSVDGVADSVINPPKDLKLILEPEDQLIVISLPNQ